MPENWGKFLTRRYIIEIDRKCSGLRNKQGPNPTHFATQGNHRSFLFDTDVFVEYL